jgi:hypothetical protein
MSSVRKLATGRIGRIKKLGGFSRYRLKEEHSPVAKSIHGLYKACLQAITQVSDDPEKQR